jgi:putative selenium metabolism protein SsnA
VTAVGLVGGTVVTSLAPPAVVRADVLVDAGRIATIGEPVPPGVRRIDCMEAVIVPGNVCAHTHLYSALARGMPYALGTPPNFVETLRRIWWRLDRAHDAESIRASALIGALEALRAGTTTLIDHHASPAAVDGSLDLVAEACARVGIRSVLCYETSDRDGPEVARAGLAENRRFLERSPEAFPLARGMVGAHASFTLSDETLADLAALTRDTGAGLHVHVAEDLDDERDAVARTGRRVVARLADAGLLDRRSLLAHGVHLDPDEIELVAGAGATVVHNPRSNMNNAVGRAPLGRLPSPLALGTDGIGADLWAEGRVAFFRHREDDRDLGPDWLLGRLADSASVAAAAFDEPRLGRIELGAPADLAVLDWPPPTPLDASTLGGHWVYGFSAAAVRDVLVDGEIVLHDRRPVLVDPVELAHEARDAVRTLWSRLESLGIHPFEPAGRVAR